MQAGVDEEVSNILLVYVYKNLTFRFCDREGEYISVLGITFVLHTQAAHKVLATEHERELVALA